MGNVRITQRLIRRLTKNSSGTISVTIPLELTYELGWDKGQSVKVEQSGKHIVITKLDGATRRGKRK